MLVLVVPVVPDGLGVPSLLALRRGRSRGGRRLLGEITIVGVPAAIGNAVFNATGRRLRDLPIRLEALL
ncbi:hypothetical protein ACFWIB_38580 [Streptomyces sp. NPDC127051]|uniref:hypothetical protein n=1 Tax=Streptomyces sp. NPDC127051 TaxID=3347119 RepID=UPI003650AF55